jgi:hypothetical protein
MIGQPVSVNTIASMNGFATSEVAYWCWGTLWSPPPGLCWETFWSPPALGSGRACPISDSCDMLLVDVWQLSNVGATAPAGCPRFGRDVRAITVSARIRFFYAGTLVVRIVLSCCCRSSCKTSCRMYKSSSSMSDDEVDSPRSSLWFLLISWSVSLSSCFITRTAQSFGISNTILEGWVGC